MNYDTSDNVKTEQNPVPITTQGALPLSDSLDLRKRIENLEARAEILKEHFDSLKATITLIMTAVLVAFVLTLISIGADYLHNNEKRYDKFIDKTTEFYTKNEVNERVISGDAIIEDKLNQLKDCLGAGFYYSCFK